MKCEKCGCYLNNLDTVCPTCGAEVSMSSLNMIKTQNQSEAIYGLKLSIIAWIAMLVLSVVHFRLGRWSFFNINFNWNVLMPLAFLAGTYISIWKKDMFLMIIPLGFYLIFPYARWFFFNRGNPFFEWFEWIDIIHSAIVIFVGITFFYCSKIRKILKQLTIINIAYAVVWCIVFVSYIIVSFSKVDFISTGEALFIFLSSSSFLRSLSFFAGTALLGLQKT